MGNTRVIFSDTNNDGEPEIIQEADYYPFGMRHDRSTTATNHYLYNGKELNEDLGLDWYDYGARWLDVETGRWSAIDPHAESYKSWTPYNYVYNNPLIYNDPTGMDGDLVNGLTIYIQNDGSIPEEVFRTSVAAYQQNVADVWGGVNGQDLSRVNYIILEGNDSPPANLQSRENILTFGTRDVSHVRGSKYNIGYMNVNDGGNTAAHEFGHFLGLSDRYYEGVTWNQSSGEMGDARWYNLPPEPVPESRIDDVNYTSGNNLYSTGSTTLTQLQINIANSPDRESDYQKNIGYFYNVSLFRRGADGVIEGEGFEFRVSRRGKVHWEKHPKLPHIARHRSGYTYEKLVNTIKSVINK